MRQKPYNRTLQKYNNGVIDYMRVPQSVLNKYRKSNKRQY